MVWRGGKGTKKKHQTNTLRHNHLRFENFSHKQSHRNWRRYQNSFIYHNQPVCRCENATHLEKLFAVVIKYSAFDEEKREFLGFYVALIETACTSNIKHLTNNITFKFIAVSSHSQVGGCVFTSTRLQSQIGFNLLNCCETTLNYRAYFSLLFYA